MEDYVFGRIYDKKINECDADYYANLFGEGSKSLTELIKYCILNNIRTFASCKGHPDEVNVLERGFETGYIVFRIYDDRLFAYFLASLPHKINGIMSSIENVNGDKSVALYVPATKSGMSDVYFEEILQQLMMYDKNKNVDISLDVKKIVDYIMDSPKNIWFDITGDIYRKVERTNNMQSKKVAQCYKNEQNNMLHKKLCNLLGKPKNVDELINYSRKK